MIKRKIICLLILLINVMVVNANESRFNYIIDVQGFDFEEQVIWSLSQNSYAFPKTIQYTNNIIFDLNNILSSSDEVRFKPEFNVVNLNGFSFDQSTGIIALNTQTHGNKSGENEISGHNHSERITFTQIPNKKASPNRVGMNYLA